MFELTRRMTTAALLVALAAGSASAGASKVKVNLAADDSAPDARGRAIAVVRHETKGRFEVRVQKLAGDASYELLIGGIKVGTLHTKGNGSAKLRFATAPKGNDLLLGFDPRGATIAVRAASGDDVLTGTVPTDPGDDPTDVVCCIPDDSGTECEDRTASECAAQGGTVSDATSCLPDPCGGEPPVDRDVVCCIPDDSGPECEDRTPAECAAQGGVAVEATSCLPNPCAGTPVPDDDEIQCCVPHDGGFECEDRTPARCAERGGVDRGPGSCGPTACAGL